MNASCDCRESNLPVVLCVLATLAIVLIFAPLMAQSFVTAVTLHQDISHAEEVHGHEAIIARDSITNCKPDDVNYWFNPGSRYQARSCQNPDGSTAVQIYKLLDGKYQEVTSFVYKNKKAFVDYMVDAGYINPAWMVP